ncbi:flagellar basal body rod protein FlgB [Ferruginivarius sediminum]|uniref:Flagellar basal body rod protein FlgB n=2 Tax=Ferruginivarius sediminum TaxID=2661937 RepID=A0A369T690_9PROT|nr:flagellar basal body rod protein FlgB [Ferruginivarius sediminum]
MYPPLPVLNKARRTFVIEDLASSDPTRRPRGVMAFAKISVFEALSRRMGWLSQRQTVLADNIANADTPGYAPQDLKEASFQGALRRALKPMAPTVTHERHVDASIPPRREPEAEESKGRYETAPSGNAVVLEEQMVKVADTQMRYQTMTNLYRKHLQMFKTAVGRGS